MEHGRAKRVLMRSRPRLRKTDTARVNGRIRLGGDSTGGRGEGAVSPNRSKARIEDGASQRKARHNRSGAER